MRNLIFLVSCVVLSCCVQGNSAITCYLGGLEDPSGTDSNCNYCGLYQSYANGALIVSTRYCLPEPSFIYGYPPTTFNTTCQCTIKTDADSTNCLYICDYDNCNDKCLHPEDPCGKGQRSLMNVLSAKN